MRSNFEGGHRSTDPDDEDPLPDGWDMQVGNLSFNKVL